MSPVETDVISAVEDDVRLERAVQDVTWGQQNHEPFKYLAILTEEVGECHKAALEAFNWKKDDPSFDAAKLNHLRTELVQVAAVAVAMIECLDRGIWQYP